MFQLHISISYNLVYVSMIRSLGVFLCCSSVSLKRSSALYRFSFFCPAGMNSEDFNDMPFCHGKQWLSTHSACRATLSFIWSHASNNLAHVSLSIRSLVGLHQLRWEWASFRINVFLLMLNLCCESIREDRALEQVGFVHNLSGMLGWT